jgi:hypothetical protein
MPKTTTAYLEDGRHIEVPSGAVRDWQDDVRNGGTTDGLAVWYTEDEESAAEIQGSADDDTRCDHDELTHRIVNESQTGPGVVKDKPMRMVRVCHRRACILDAMAWVERGTCERHRWATAGAPCPGCACCKRSVPGLPSERRHGGSRPRTRVRAGPVLGR